MSYLIPDYLQRDDLTDAQKMTLRALDLSMGSGLTNAAVDRQRARVALLAGRAAGLGDETLALVLDKRAAHRTWVTLTQRQWQSGLRHMTGRAIGHYLPLAGQDPVRAVARVQESIATREKYVRCA